MWPILKPYTIELLRIAWNDAAEDGLVEGSFDVENPYVQDVLKDTAKRITGIDDTTRDLIRAITGQTELSTAEKRARLMDLMGTTPARAEMIARTETASAVEGGNHIAWKESGVVDRKEWLLGPEPCELCEPLGGKVVGLDDEFSEGIAHPPLHPNCTCATAPVVKEQ
jgi:SPP1 gp7 family putative phage head morphogenesis protein